MRNNNASFILIYRHDGDNGSVGSFKVNNLLNFSWQTVRGVALRHNVVTFRNVDFLKHLDLIVDESPHNFNMLQNPLNSSYSCYACGY